MKLVKTATLAKALKTNKKTLFERAEKENWKYVKRGNRFYWLETSLSDEVKNALLSQNKKLKTVVKQAKPASKFLQVTENERSVAKMRGLILNAYKLAGVSVPKFCKAFASDERYETLRAVYKKKLAESTLYDWLKAFKKDGIDGITPDWSNGARKAGDVLTKEEKSCLVYFYLDYRKRSMRHCWLAMRANLKTSVATENTCYRFLKSLPQDLVTLRRDGCDKFNDKYLPYIEGDKDLYASLDKVQSDHHTLDVLIKKGKSNLRPYLTSFIDYYSGAVLGWCLSTCPSSQTILASYHMMVTRYGVPKMVHVDNGADYKGKTIKGTKEKIKITIDGKTEIDEEIEILGGITLCGSELHFATPYRGRAKGMIEKFHRTFEEYFGKNTVSYLGSDTTARVDEQRLLFRAFKGFEKRGDVMEWQDCVKAVASFIDAYNNTNIFRDPDAEIPMQKFIKNLPEKINKPSLATIELALTKGEIRTVQRNGVRFGKSYYWAEDLMRLVGQQVVARINLVSQNEVLVCDKSGKLICKAYADVFAETGNMETDNANLNRVHRELRHSISADENYQLPSRPKTLLDIAIDATGETPNIADYVPFAENKNENKLSDKTENKKLPRPKDKGKYKNYFDIDDDEFLKAFGF